MADEHADHPGIIAPAVMSLLSRVEYAVEVATWTHYWMGLFVVCRSFLFRKYTPNFSNRIVSIVHAIAAIYYSVQTFENGFASLFENVGGANTKPQALCMAVSLSYFIYDLCYCAMVGERESVVHHLFTIAGLASGLLNGKSGAELVGCLFLMEVSNPSLHLRDILREMKLKDGPIGSANDLFFAVAFLVCRLVIGPFIVYETVMCPHNELVVKLGGLGILVVSVMWSVKIVKMIAKEVKKLSGGKSAKTSSEKKKTK